jgi:hypothetical protein
MPVSFASIQVAPPYSTLLSIAAGVDVNLLAEVFAGNVNGQQVIGSVQLALQF